MARDNKFGTGGGFVRSCKWSRFPRYHAWPAMCLIRVNASHAADDFPRRCLEQFASRRATYTFCTGTREAFRQPPSSCTPEIVSAVYRARNAPCTRKIRGDLQGKKKDASVLWNVEYRKRKYGNERKNVIQPGEE